MKSLNVQQRQGLRGRVSVPGDKSISHRALMLGALAQGVSRVRNLLWGGDCLATLGCLRALGIEIDQDDRNENVLTIHGRGLRGLRPPTAPLDCIRSGTTMRMLAGILAGQGFDSILTGDPQLLRRPMRRVVEPLSQMGAEIVDTDGHGPLTIRGRPLHGIDHVMAIASAQVKSALLLAGLYAAGPTTVRQPGPARDHTELMLRAMGANLVIDGPNVTIKPGNPLHPLDLDIPGDFSSAAFLLAAGVIVPNSKLVITGVNLNPTRTGLLDVLGAMGATIAIENQNEQGGEPVGDLVVQSANLQSTTIQGDTVVRMIDEFPVLAVIATQAAGQTQVRDAQELRVKETDRIATVVEELRKLGAEIEPTDDGFIVNGPTSLRGAVVNSHGDHRLAMALVVAGLIAEGETTVQNTDCIADSFPGFEEVIRKA